jgi:hypothetical protein
MAENQNFAVYGIHVVKCSLYAERRLNVKAFSSIKRRTSYRKVACGCEEPTRRTFWEEIT